MTAGSLQASPHTILIRRSPDSENELDDILDHHGSIETRCLTVPRPRPHAYCVVRRLGDKTGGPLLAKQRGGGATGTR